MTSPHLQRFAIMLSAYNYELLVVHVAGEKISNTDGLSRLPMDNSKDSGRSVNVPGAIIMNLQTLDLTPLTSGHIKRWTNEDKVLSKVKKCFLEGDWTISPEMGDEFKPYTKRKNELSLEAGVILCGARVVVPDKGRALLDELHESHPGASKMKSIARAHSHVVAKNG